MKKYLLLFLVIFSSSSLFACGGGELYFFDFHSLFIGGQKSEVCNCGNSGNIEEWKTFFNGRYDTNINKIIYSYSVDDMKDLKVNESNPLYVEAFDYLIYAKELGVSSKRVSGAVSSYSWNYKELLKHEKFDEDLLDKGIRAFKKATNDELKMRYAYQIVRYLHYNSKWEEAVSFFENHVPQLNLQNELYYYCLDQVSGCYYSLKDYTTAAYGFLQVVMKSKDRKRSASISFNIHSNWDFESLLEKCETPNERILARTLLTPYHYNYDDAKWIVENEFDEQALMSIYYYTDVHLAEEYFWLNTYNESSYFKYREKEFIHDEQLIQEILKRNDLKHRDFWNCCMAYFSFRLKRFGDASKYINQIDKLTVIDEDRYAFFKYLFTVLGEGVVNDEVENEIYRIYENQVITKKEDHVINDLFYNMVITFYIANDNFLKANLMTHRKANIDQYYDFETLDKLDELNKDKNKNELEKFLLKSSLGEIKDVDSYLIEKKASLYLMHNNYDEAKLLFDQLPEYYKNVEGVIDQPKGRSYKFGGYRYVPKKIFSINIREGFNFTINTVLTDEVCFDGQFDFIKKVFTKGELNNYLIELNRLASSGNIEANYLLGNYYYNVSGLGYFRNILLYYPDNNACSTCKTDPVLQDYWYKSNVYYSQVIINTSDEELKAKVTYLMSKNLAFKDMEISNSGPGASRSEECYELFQELNTTYSNTKFYSEILEECTVFSYFVGR